MNQALFAALLVCLPLAGQNAPGQVIGVGGFTHIVADLDRSLKFYVDGLGLELIRPVPPFGMPDWIRKMGNTPTGDSRAANLRVPGSQLGVELIEYKDIERHPIRPRPSDPGAAMLVLGVPNARAIAFKHRGGITYSLGCTTQVQDDDGFYLVAHDARQPTAGFRIVVADLDETLRIYRDILGFSPKIDHSEATALIPGTQVEIRWIESKNGTTMHSRVPDPGTPILQLQVRDARAAVRALKAAGVEIISEGGEVVPRDNGGAFVIVRDPNNLFLELFQRPE